MGKLSTPDSESPTPTISHFSHPHPLQPLNPQSLQVLTMVSCSCCHVEASGSVYACVACNYFLHEKCSQLPAQITHPFDQQHPFTLLPTPKYQEGVFSCDACGKPGTGFCYHCESCGKDLHTACATLPMVLSHPSHPHQLSLTFAPPYHGSTTFSCDICKKVGSKYWLYRCNRCEFDAHLSCVTRIQIQIQTAALRTRALASPTPAGINPNPAGFAFQYPGQSPLPGFHGPVGPIGAGQAQHPAMGMPYPARAPTPAMQTIPPIPFMNATFPQPGFPQQAALAQQQALMQQQQLIAQQQAVALAQQQALMRQSQAAAGNPILTSVVGGLASGFGQAASGAAIQAIFGGGGTRGGGFDPTGGTGVAAVDPTAFDASGGVYDGGFGGTDGGGGGDATYY